MKGINMEQINNTTQVSVIPDSEERRQIRKQYNRTALIMLINILFFNVVALIVSRFIFAYYGGGFEREALIRGKEIFYKNEFVSTLFSCLIPIVSEVTVIIFGTKILNLNLKSLVTRDGYSGGTVMKLITLIIGTQTAGSIIIVLIGFVLEKFGLSGETVDISATTSFGANAFLCFYVCLLGPVLEELLYRGVLLQSMRKYNERFAIFLSAAVFGLMHQNYQQCIPAFISGVALAVVTIKYNSILPSIFAHIIANTSNLLFGYMLQYADPDYYTGTIPDTLPQGGALAVVIVNAIFHYGFLIAALIVGIVALVKGNNMTVPTPAGKARSRVFFSCVLWWIVLAAYVYFCFIEPFMK